MKEKRRKRGDTYGDDLLGNELGNPEEIVVSRNTKQESNRVEDVGQNGLESQGRVVDVDVVTPPGKEAVDETDSSENAEQRGNDGATNLDSEPSTVGKGVQGVFSLVLVVVGDDDTASGKSLLSLGIAKLGDGEGGGDGHDARGDERLSIKTKTNVTNQDGAGNGGETTGQDLVKLGIGHVGDEGTDQHGRLSLTDERGGGSDDGLGTRGIESPEDEDGHLLDEPLDEANVVQDLHQGDEEDDGGDDAKEEPGERGHVGGGQKGNTIVSEAKQVSGTISNELEDVVTNAGSQDKETNDVLAQHTTNDGSPVDVLAGIAGDPEAKEDDEHAKQADGTVGARVVGALLGAERASKDGSEGYSSTGGSAQLLGDAVIDDESRALPHPLDGVGDVAHGHMEEEQTDRDGQPQQEGDDPVLVVAMQDQRRNPPAGEEQEDEDVDKGAEVAVGDAKVPVALRARLVGVDSCANDARLADLFVVAVVRRRVDVLLVDAAHIVSVILDWHQRRVQVGALCVDGIIMAGSVDSVRVMLMVMVVLVSRLQGRIRVVVDALGGIVVGSRVGSGF